MRDRWRRWLQALTALTGRTPVRVRAYGHAAGPGAAGAWGDAEFDWVAAVDEARRDWEHARRYFECVTDEDLVDQAIHLVNAAEKRYAYLLKQARRRGIQGLQGHLPGTPTDRQDSRVAP